MEREREFFILIYSSWKIGWKRIGGRGGEKKVSMISLLNRQREKKEGKI